MSHGYGGIHIEVQIGLAVINQSDTGRLGRLVEHTKTAGIRPVAISLLAFRSGTHANCLHALQHHVAVIGLQTGAQ